MGNNDHFSHSDASTTWVDVGVSITDFIDKIGDIAGASTQLATAIHQAHQLRGLNQLVLEIAKPQGIGWIALENYAKIRDLDNQATSILNAINAGKVDSGIVNLISGSLRTLDDVKSFSHACNGVSVLAASINAYKLISSAPEQDLTTKQQYELDQTRVDFAVDAVGLFGWVAGGSVAQITGPLAGGYSLGQLGIYVINKWQSTDTEQYDVHDNLSEVLMDVNSRAWLNNLEGTVYLFSAHQIRHAREYLDSASTAQNAETTSTSNENASSDTSTTDSSSTISSTYTIKGEHIHQTPITTPGDLAASNNNDTISPDVGSSTTNESDRQQSGPSISQEKYLIPPDMNEQIQLPDDNYDVCDDKLPTISPDAYADSTPSIFDPPGGHTLKHDAGGSDSRKWHPPMDTQPHIDISQDSGITPPPLLLPDSAQQMYQVAPDSIHPAYQAPPDDTSIVQDEKHVEHYSQVLPDDSVCSPAYANGENAYNHSANDRQTHLDATAQEQEAETVARDFAQQVQEQQQAEEAAAQQAQAATWQQAH